MNDKIKNLPTFYLLADPRKQEKLAIPAQVYIENVKDDSVIVENITLNFKIISSNKKVGYYVEPKNMQVITLYWELALLSIIT